MTAPAKLETVSATDLTHHDFAFPCKALDRRCVPWDSKIKRKFNGTNVSLHCDTVSKMEITGPKRLLHSYDFATLKSLGDMKLPPNIEQKTKMVQVLEFQKIYHLYFSCLLEWMLKYI